MRLSACFLLFSLFSASATAQPFIMYPGDTNNDGAANHYDLLPIGIAYNQTGPPRQPATILWVPQIVEEPWDAFLPVSGINLAFVDCNGMDTINSLDIFAIALNYDSTQNNSFPPPSPYQPKLIDTCFSCPPPNLLVTFNKDIVDVTGQLEAYIQLQYPFQAPAPLGALGIAFDVEYYYTNTIIDSLTQVFPDTFPNSRMYVVARHTEVLTNELLPAAGRMGFAAAGRGENVFIATDTLMTVSFVIDAMIIRDDTPDTFSLRISNVLILNNLEQVITLGKIITDSVVVVSTKTSASAAPSLTISPNPVRDLLTVESSGAPIERVDIRSLAGEQMLSLTAHKQHRVELPVASLPAGIWVAVVHTRGSVTTKKFVKRE
ncbi:MAG: T9SS type A sorting domain-containing protein [Saprospiraceae bacterium]|nr:T9SS type A sorting domain-containing protein [Saprospiraceae bacterium]